MFLLTFFALLVAGVAADKCACPSEFSQGRTTDVYNDAFWKKAMAEATTTVNMTTYGVYWVGPAPVPLDNCTMILAPTQIGSPFGAVQYFITYIGTEDQTKFKMYTLPPSSIIYPAFQCGTNGKWMHNGSVVTAFRNLVVHNFEH